MQKILVICDRIPPEHSATGKIAFSIAKELSKHSQVFLVCLTSKKMKYENERITIDTYTDRYGQYQEKVQTALNSFGFNKTFRKVVYHVYYYWAKKKGFSSVNSHENQLKKKCREIIVANDIDTILSVSNPFDCHKIASSLVQSNSKLRWYAYMMDSNRNNAVSAGCRDEEIHVFRNVKKIFIMPALLNDNDFLKDFEGKFSVLNLPIIPMKCKNGHVNDTSDIVFIYAGMFYREIRNPKHLLDLFTKLPQNYVLHLYSKGCEDIVKEYQTILGRRLQVKGFIVIDELEKRISEANILVNIGNTVNNQVPSKVYESIAFGKPILNLFQRQDDISVQHLTKYPVFLNLPYGKVNTNELADVVQWCEKVRNVILDYDEATKYLPENRLDNIVKVLETDLLGK